MDESFGGVLNFVESLGDLVDRNEQLELVLDFNQIVTVVAGSSRVLGSINTAGHHDSKRDKVSDDLVDNVTNTVLTRVGADSRVEHNIAVLKVYLNVEDGLEAVQLVVGNVELVLEEDHRAIDTIGDTIDNKTVNVVLVGEPLR